METLDGQHTFATESAKKKSSWDYDGSFSTGQPGTYRHAQPHIFPQKNDGT